MCRLLAPLLFGLGCAHSVAIPPTHSVAAVLDPPLVRVGNRVILQSEADQRAGESYFKAQDQLYELRLDSAERIAIEHLVAQEAARENISEDTWLERNVERGLPRPSEGELQEFFSRVKKNLPEGTAFADVKPQLERAAQRDARVRKAQEVFEGLKKRANYTVLLAPMDRPRKMVDSTGPGKGPLDAKVVIVEFADFQCPYCVKAAETMRKLMDDYRSKVRLVFRHFPLDNHPLAPKAAEASACANEQGKFWEYHDYLFSHPRALDETSLKAHAVTLELEVKPFVECLESGRMKELVENDRKIGEALGVTGTPAFFVNGLLMSGAQSEESFRRVIERELGR